MTSQILQSRVPLFRALAASMSVLAAAPALSAEASCPQTDTGIVLPKGFCASVFADKIGHARQMAVAPNGTVFVNTWSGVYYNNDTPPDGGFLVALKDMDGDGRAEHVERFGQTFAEGGKGGTGVYLHKDWVYAELNDKIVRYAL
jgi:glucose/arabinose dehydrogenase